jgi:hypothetical protein
MTMVVGSKGGCERSSDGENSKRVAEALEPNKSSQVLHDVMRGT